MNLQPKKRGSHRLFINNLGAKVKYLVGGGSCVYLGVELTSPI